MPVSTPCAPAGAAREAERRRVELRFDGDQPVQECDAVEVAQDARLQLAEAANDEAPSAEVAPAHRACGWSRALRGHPGRNVVPARGTGHPRVVPMLGRAGMVGEADPEPARVDGSPLRA